ncbi:MAG: UvrD-helicase domain-containing protein [Rubrivivax sp.]|nr:UvrD-helicase domain-containing protein [Rubrivivax sp.]
MNTTPAYRIDGQRAAADAFYAAACDPRRSVVVEACAGAGKTWMLVSRILRALLDGAEPQQILAITFTRKAAGEMRERLDDWLAAHAAHACDEATRIAALRQRGLSAAEAVRLAPALGGLHERLLKSGRAVEVRTFHAWFTQLLSHAPLSLVSTLGLPLQHELVEDDAVLHDALLRRFHRAVQRDDGLRDTYMALVRRHGRSAVAEWLDQARRRGAEIQRADAAGHAADAVPSAAAMWPVCQGLADPAELLRRQPLAADLDLLAREMGQQTTATPQKAAGQLRDALSYADALAAFEGVWAALFTRQGEPRKKLGDTALQQSVVETLQGIAHMRRQQQAHDDHVALLRLVRVLLLEYARLKRGRGLVDMADLERAAEALLGDSTVAGWVQERLDQRVRHVLIDEFQDTSPLQWQALQGWLSSYAGAGGGASGQQPPAVFIVGDPKQSIYRFRNAEPRVFVAAREFVVQALEGQALACDHTRRNAPEVIAALNAVFAEAQFTNGWGPFRAHTTGADGAGAVCRLPGVPHVKTVPGGAGEGWRDSLTQPRREPEAQRRAEEAAQLAAAVAELLHTQGYQPAEVMVLARKRAMLAAVADALAARAVPHVVAEPLHLHESPEALDLVALLDALASPAHDMAFARALKSPLFGASDEDLLWLAGIARGRPWLRALRAAEAVPSAALARAQGLLAGWHPAVQVLPPHDLLDRIVHEGDLRGRLAAAVPADRRAAALGALDALLSATLEHRGARLMSVYTFVRELRAGRVAAAAAAPPDAVRLLTVHGAKGLEARAVLIADCDPVPRNPARHTVLVDWPVDSVAPRRVAFVKSLDAPPPSLLDLVEEEAAAAAREELNGLYVAMTRARERLVFSRTEPHRRSGPPSWWLRVESRAALWEPRPPPSLPAEARTVQVPILPVVQAPGPGALPDGPRDTAAARLGQTVHRLLEWAGRPGAPLPLDALPAAAEAAAQAFGLAAAEAPRAAEVARTVLTSAAVAPFFRGEALRWAGNEVPVAEGGEVLRIDRLVLLAGGGDGPDTWWVLDYKLQTGAVSLPLHAAQLARYVAAVQALQPGDRVRAAIVTGSGQLLPL